MRAPEFHNERSAPKRPRSPGGHGPDLADHFLSCAKLGRYLTTFDDSRYLITDDFQRAKNLHPIVATTASIFSKDPLVAQIALVPLSKAAGTNTIENREKLEELFTLIEARALSNDARECAHAILESDFRESRIQALERELGGRMSPARRRYRQFLEIVRALAELKISAQAFRDEFADFTHAVAGRLDFGIYSFCIDRILGNDRIAEKAKTLLVDQILNFPPLIRRELLTNALSARATPPGVAAYIRHGVNTTLGIETATEIFLLEGLKTRRITAEELEQRIRRRPTP